MRKYLYNLATDKSRGLIAAIFKFFLFVLSLIYGLAVRILIYFNCLKPYRLPCKVIAVGNITLGGTGKTVLVESISRYLKQQGHKVAILSRGYKRKITHYELGVTGYETMGDEPFMLQNNLKDVPVLVDKNRIRASERAIRDYGVDTVILDDGFQQWKINKDLEIVTIDVTSPFGNRYLLPRGILREPLSSLKRADIFVLTKTNLRPDIQEIKDFLGQINPAAQVFESIHRPLGFYNLGESSKLINIDTLKGKTVTLISGIGNPASFENLIANLGIKIGLSFRFADHHNYTRQDLDKIIQSSKNKNIDTIITTEKDAVRLNGLRYTLYGMRFLVLRIELKIIKDEEGFNLRLLKL